MERLYDLSRSVERAARVVRADAEIRGELLDARGRTCAVGGLMVAAGIRPRVGQERPTRAQMRELERRYPVLRLSLSPRGSFVERSLVDAIIERNDACKTRHRRVRAIERLLEEAVAGIVP